jgi:hypothetical protein
LEQLDAYTSSFRHETVDTNRDVVGFKVLCGELREVGEEAGGFGNAT